MLVRKQNPQRLPDIASTASFDVERKSEPPLSLMKLGESQISMMSPQELIATVDQRESMGGGAQSQLAGATAMKVRPSFVSSITLRSTSLSSN